MAKCGFLLLSGVLGRSFAQENKRCHSISTVVADAWCNKNCNWTPPNCPADICRCGPTPSPPPVPPVPPPSPPSPRAPLSPEAAVKYLNDFYMGFDEKDDASPLGVTMTMTSNPGTFYGNIFCSTFDNPHGRTYCHAGFVDCRLSASLYNHKMIMDKETHTIRLGLQKKTGYVINQTRVEAFWAKCSYIWDGATQNRVNRGCGLGAPTMNCADRRAAFSNICPSTGQTCSFNAKEVQGALCKPYGGSLPISSNPTYNPCVFPGPAIDWHDQAEYNPRGSYLRDMARERVAHNGENVDKWNEVVIDATLMLHDISIDAAQVVTAFVYARSGMPGSKTSAERMRDEYCKVSNIAPIPVVEVDDVTYQPNGPFTLPTAEPIVLV